jgi:hypothetical protein
MPVKGEEEGEPLDPEEEDTTWRITMAVAACTTPLTHMAAGVSAAATWTIGPGPTNSTGVFPPIVIDVCDVFLM